MAFDISILHQLNTQANTSHHENRLRLHNINFIIFAFMVSTNKPYKVLNLSSNDYANYANDNARALRSIGIDCKDGSINAHPFGYKTQGVITTANQIISNYKKYDCVQIFHTDMNLYNLVKDHHNIVVYHTGTRFRQQSEHYAKAFPNAKIATDQCEFLLHYPDMYYIAPHTELKPVAKSTSGKLIIGHYPSNPDVKGTAQIERMLAPFINDFDIRIDTKKLTHEENLKRVAECHIYVELFAPTQNGKPYGCFGTSAFESTALGALTITNNINRKAYEDVYGHQPFLTPHTEREFQNTIFGLADRESYDIAKEAMHVGFYDKHSITETGRRILRLIER